MKIPVGKLPKSELRKRAVTCRTVSTRLNWSAGIWIGVVFFTFIPVPMPFTGLPAVLVFVGVPLVALIVAHVYRRQATYYDTLAAM